MARAWVVPALVAAIGALVVLQQLGFSWGEAWRAVPGAVSPLIRVAWPVLAAVAWLVWRRDSGRPVQYLALALTMQVLRTAMAMWPMATDLLRTAVFLAYMGLLGLAVLAMASPGSRPAGLLVGALWLLVAAEHGAVVRGLVPPTPPVPYAALQVLLNLPNVLFYTALGWLLVTGDRSPVGRWLAAAVAGHLAMGLIAMSSFRMPTVQVAALLSLAVPVALGGTLWRLAFPPDALAVAPARE